MSYNEKVQKIMKDKSNKLKTLCCDKLYLKTYVLEKTGLELYPKTYEIADNIEELVDKIDKNSSHVSTFWVKANNDSGGTIKVENKDTKYILSVKNHLEKYKNISYGLNKGEWFYGGIKYKCFTEESIGYNMTDYKFHCTLGTPRFCQVIRDRELKTKKTNEVCVKWDKDYNPEIIEYRFDYQFEHIKCFDKPKNFDKMVELCGHLSKDFDYVRVDMYNVEGQIYVGELTFAPMSGKYRGKENAYYGKFLVGI